MVCAPDTPAACRRLRARWTGRKTAGIPAWRAQGPGESFRHSRPRAGFWVLPNSHRERLESPGAGVVRSRSPKATRGAGGGGVAAHDPSRLAGASPHDPRLPAPPARRPRRPPPAPAATRGGPIGAPEGARPRPQAGGARRGEGARPHPAPAPGASPRSPRPGRRRPAQPLARAARRDAPPPPPGPTRPPLGPRPRAPGSRGAKVTAPPSPGWAWTPAGRGPGTLLGSRGPGRGVGGGGGREEASLPKAPRVPTGRPVAQGAGTLRVWGWFCKVPGERRGAEHWSGRAVKPAAGGGGARRAVYAPSCPGKGREGTGRGRKCRNVGPLGEAGAESGKWGAGGTAGEMDQAPCPLPNRRIPGRAGMRSSRPVPLGPRQPAVPSPLPRGATLPIRTPCLPEGTFSGQSLSRTSNLDRPRHCSVLASTRQGPPSLKPIC